MYLSFVLALSVGSVQVTGSSACPTPGAVESRLQRGSASPDDSSFEVRLTEAADALQIELSTTSGERLAIRQLTGPHGCDERAAAAALVIATWLADLDTGLSPPQLAPARAAASAPRKRASWHLGLGVLGALDSAAPTFGATAYASYGDTGLGTWAELGFAGPRELPFDPGAARYQRLWGGVGPRLLLERERMFAEANVQARGAVLWVSGRGYDEPARSVGLHTGVAAGGKVGYRFGGLSPFGGVGAVRWFPQQRVRVEGLPGAASLPAFEGWLVAGISWWSL